MNKTQMADDIIKMARQELSCLTMNKTAAIRNAMHANFVNKALKELCAEYDPYTASAILRYYLYCKEDFKKDFEKGVAKISRNFVKVNDIFDSVELGGQAKDDQSIRLIERHYQVIKVGAKYVYFRKISTKNGIPIPNSFDNDENVILRRNLSDFEGWENDWCLEINPHEFARKY